MLTVDSFAIWEASSRDTIDFKKIYVDVADGDFMAGFGLSELIYWILPNKRGESKLRIEREGKKWIRISYDEWLDRTGIKEDAVRRIYKVLKGLDLIEVKLFRFNGSPSVHVWVNVGVLVARLNSVMSRMESGKSQDSNPVNPQNPIRVNAGFQSGESPEFLTETLTKTTTETTTFKIIESAVPPGARQPETLPIPFDETPKPNPKRLPTTPNGFEEFWQAYPKKVAKPEALKAWAKLKPDADTQADIQRAIAERSQGDPQWAEQRFIPNPATYLNQRRWEDEWRPKAGQLVTAGGRRPTQQESTYNYLLSEMED